MRQLTALGVVLGSLSVGTVSAQNDLARLLRTDQRPVSVDFQNADVADTLDRLAVLGGFDVFLAPVLDHAAPVTLAAENADLQTVLRTVLDGAGLTYRVVDEDTLIVDGPPNAFLDPTLNAKARLRRCYSGSVDTRWLLHRHVC